MTVSGIMSQPPWTCSPETPLAQAARLMREADCGLLAVLDSRGGIRGVITDRDVCMAIARSNRSPNAIAVHEVMTSLVTTASADAEVHAALASMKRARVRRLPVLNAAGRLAGILSLEDIVVRGGEAGAVRPDEIVDTMRAIYERRPAAIEPARVAAVA